MAHRPAPSRNCSEFRAMQLGLCSRRRGDPMSSRYGTSCISVARPAADHVQAGSSDVLSSEHVHSGLHARPNHGTYLQPNFTFICHHMLLVQPFTRIDFSSRAFRFSTPSVWNSLPQRVLISDLCF